MELNKKTLFILTLVLLLVSLFNIATMIPTTVIKNRVTGNTVHGSVTLFINRSLITNQLVLISNDSVGNQNWFSVPYIQLDDSIDTVLSSLGTGVGSQNEVWKLPGCTGNVSDNFVGNYTIVWTYDASDRSDPWKSYTPSKPCFQIPNEELRTVTHLSTYQIVMNETDTLEVSGIDPINTTIELYNGINWAGYPSTYSKSVTTALSSLGSGIGSQNEIWDLPGCTGNASDNFVGSYTIVWTYNIADTPQWKSFTPNKPCFTIDNELLNTMMPMRGYQIVMNESANWSIDW